MPAPTVLGSTQTLTTAATITPDTGANYLVVVSHAADNVAADTPSSVTWDGVSLTKQIDKDNTLTANAIWTLTSPTTAAASLNWTGGASVRGLMILWLSGVSTATPVRGSTASSAAASSALSVTIASDVNDLVVYGISERNAETLSTANGIVEHQENTNANGKGALGSETGAASQTGGWTKATAGEMAITAISLQGPTGFVPPMRVFLFG